MTNQFMVKALPISISVIDGENFISLTDLVKDFPSKSIPAWLRKDETVGVLATWEEKYNPNFNLHDSAIIKDSAGVNTFNLSVKQWIAKTGAIGIKAVAGKFGGTYAHHTIALEFCTYLNFRFRLEVLEGYENYIGGNDKNVTKEWLYNRFLSKEKYPVHTKAVKTYLEPNLKPYEVVGKLYGKEANHLNVAVFGLKHADWVKLNPELAKGDKNQRDYASVPELLALTSLEVISATLIEMGLSEQDRINHLNKRAKELIEQFTKQNLKLIK